MTELPPVREVPVVVWDGAYESSWRDLIVPAAFAHPAKMSRSLLDRIVIHLFDLGVQKGDTVLDPFGGIGTTAIVGASHGLRVVCVELEPRFVTLAKLNVIKWKPDWDAMDLPTPIIIEGDSRFLREAMSYTDAVVSSPPFTQGYSGGGGINKRGYNPAGGEGADKVGDRTYQGTGAEREPGNLEAMPFGTIDAVLASPPYAAISTGAGGLNTKPIKHPGQQGGRSRAAASQDTDQRYGNSTGQLAKLKDVARSQQPIDGDPQVEPHDIPQSFWTGAKLVVAETYAVLKPGGLAVWVVKAFVRDKKRVDFPGDWRKLCEHVGFETIEEVHASLVYEVRTSGLFGEKVVRRERKSFFRRLAEKKGSPRIDYETVYFMRKPA